MNTYYDKNKYIINKEILLNTKHKFYLNSKYTSNIYINTNISKTLNNSYKKPILKKNPDNNIDNLFKNSLNRIKNTLNKNIYSKNTSIKYKNKLLKPKSQIKKNYTFFNKIKNNSVKIDKINIFNLFQNSKILNLSKQSSNPIYNYQMQSTNSINFNSDIKIINWDFNDLFNFLTIKFLNNFLYKEKIKTNLLSRMKNYKKINNKNSSNNINYKFDIFDKDILITEEIILNSLNSLIKLSFDKYNIGINFKTLSKFLIK